jgi:hypothetical protein
MRIFVALVAVVSVCLFSCQREIIDPNVDQAGVDSSFLSKIIYLDTTLPSGMDTVSKGVFSYDNQKRLSNLLVNGPAIITSSYSFSYNGTDSIPKLVVETDFEYNGPGTKAVDSVFFVYSGNQVIKDSILEWRYPLNALDGAYVRTFSVSGSTVKMYGSAYANIGNVLTFMRYDSAVYTVTKAAGNITSQTRVTGFLASIQSQILSYDTHPNPLGKVFKFRYACFTEGIFIDEDIQNNNWLSEEFLGAGAPDTITRTQSHRYRPDGYPVSTNLLSVSGGTGPDWNKVVYLYRSL